MSVEDAVIAMNGEFSPCRLKRYCLDQYQRFDTAGVTLCVTDIDESPPVVVLETESLQDFSDWLETAPAGFMCCFDLDECSRMFRCGNILDMLWSKTQVLPFNVSGLIKLFSLGGRAQSGGFKNNLIHIDHYPPHEDLVVDFTRVSDALYDNRDNGLLSRQFILNADCVRSVCRDLSLVEIAVQCCKISGVGWRSFQKFNGLQRFVENVVHCSSLVSGLKAGSKRRLSPNNNNGGGGVRIIRSDRGLYAETPGLLVHMLDFRSMYPSILCIHCKDHPLKPLVEFLLNDKIDKKKRGKKLEAMASKFSCNGIYGNLGNPHSVLYDPFTAESIRRIGGEMTTLAENTALKMGFKVPFGHTDSIFVVGRQERVEELCREVSCKTGIVLENEGSARAMYIISKATYVMNLRHHLDDIVIHDHPPLTNESRNFVYKNAAGLFNKNSPPMFDYIMDRVFFTWIFYDIATNNNNNMNDDDDNMDIAEMKVELRWNGVVRNLELLKERLSNMWKHLKGLDGGCYYYDPYLWSYYRKINKPLLKRGNMHERRERDYDLVVPGGCGWDPQHTHIPKLVALMAKTAVHLCPGCSWKDIERLLLRS